jgi:hypothetical protein
LGVPPVGEQQLHAFQRAAPVRITPAGSSRAVNSARRMRSDGFCRPAC